MINFLKYIYYRTLFGKVLIHLYHSAKNRLLSDKLFIEKHYKKKFGKTPDLNKPSTLNEKILWLKLYDRTQLHTRCADKYEVREYVAEKIGADYVVPLYYHTFSPEDINLKNIKDIPCIVKTNHDSGGGFFIRNLKEVDWSGIQKNLQKRMQKNFYLATKEWQYKNIKPRIIVEKLLQDSEGNIPFDYKLHCFNGKVRMIQVDLGRDTKHHYRNWYNTNWEREPYKWSSPKGNGVYTDPSKDEVKRPDTLEKMIELSQILSTPFDYVRVDWYDVDGDLYFGELTFHHDGGFEKILPKEWDLKLGQELQLNTAKKN